MSRRGLGGLQRTAEDLYTSLDRYDSNTRAGTDEDGCRFERLHVGTSSALLRGSRGAFEPISYSFGSISCSLQRIFSTSSRGRESSHVLVLSEPFLSGLPPHDFFYGSMCCRGLSPPLRASSSSAPGLESGSSAHLKRSHVVPNVPVPLLLPCSDGSRI